MVKNIGFVATNQKQGTFNDWRQCNKKCIVCVKQCTNISFIVDKCTNTSFSVQTLCKSTSTTDLKSI